MERTEVRKSIKYKPPVIRQTLTSIYRIAKANPLLFIENAPKINDVPSSIDINKSKLPSSLKPVTKIVQQTPRPKPNLNTLKQKPKQTITRSVNNGVENKQIKSFRAPLMHTKPVSKPKANLFHLSRTKEKVLKTVPEEKSTNKKVITRRSLSADHYEKKKLLKVNFNVEPPTNLENKYDLMTPLGERRVKFQVPDNLNSGPSTPFTPTPFVKKHSTPYVVRTNYQLSDLHKRLNEWLKLNKKPVENYQCLKSFGSKSENDEYNEENKENIVEKCPISGSYEDLRIRTPITPKDPENLQDVVQGSLKDLYKLIMEGFSIEQSEAWLNVISQKYQFLEDEPQYWECRAAIEQNRGNITCAVDCLRTAIVQGAEISCIDRSLEQLLHKFSLLNINTSTSEKLDESSIKNERARIVKDARNVFKSSIIQFAIQERNIKKKALEGEREKKFVATPVRRSTRLTPSRYRVTPKVQIYSSLQDLDDNMKSNMDFCSNKQLNIRFSNVKKKKD
ncbi:hypothetical protein RN001_009704 [Aquatica leii]|uniref:Uncharacterized protein n=1 Tax=Aquatica leii TaxID=1421715 RepID=A0AAN7SN02_9COLE|nr:hypothetical protein RN001_009704 [Aquatica leii]